MKTSIMGFCKQIANRETVYRVSDYIRKAWKASRMVITRKQVLFALARLQRHHKACYVLSGEKVLITLYKAI